MSAPLPEWWVRARFRDDEVWAGLEGDSSSCRLARVDGVVPYRYRGTEGERVYRTQPSRIQVIGNMAVQLPPAVWADEKRSANTRRSPPPTDSRVDDLVRDLAVAKRRIVELESELRRERASRRITAAPALPPVDLDDLLRLCHPDRHPAERGELANRITRALLDAKRGRG